MCFRVVCYCRFTFVRDSSVVGFFVIVPHFFVVGCFPSFSFSLGPVTFSTLPFYFRFLVSFLKFSRFVRLIRAPCLTHTFPRKPDTENLHFYEELSIRQLGKMKRSSQRLSGAKRWMPEIIMGVLSERKSKGRHLNKRQSHSGTPKFQVLQRETETVITVELAKN